MPLLSASAASLRVKSDWMRGLETNVPILQRVGTVTRQIPVAAQPVESDRQIPEKDFRMDDFLTKI